MAKKPLNPWIPITDRVQLALLGKLGEECGELTQAVCRCIIQGVDECEPVTGKKNVDALQDEIADVLALIDIVIDNYNLLSEIDERISMKREHVKQWLRLIEYKEVKDDGE